jgi:hypothetical protein
MDSLSGSQARRDRSARSLVQAGEVEADEQDAGW